jgi:hypothetical protein
MSQRMVILALFAAAIVHADTEPGDADCAEHHISTTCSDDTSLLQIPHKNGSTRVHGIVIAPPHPPQLPLQVLASEEPEQPWRWGPWPGAFQHQSRSMAKQEQHQSREWLYVLAGLLACMGLQILLNCFPSVTSNPFFELALWLVLGVTCAICAFLLCGTQRGEQWTMAYFLDLFFNLDYCLVGYIVAKSLQMPLDHATKVFQIIVMCQVLVDAAFMAGLASLIKTFWPMPFALGAWLMALGYLAGIEREAPDLVGYAMADTKGSSETTLLATNQVHPPVILERRLTSTTQWTYKAAKQVFGTRLIPMYEKDGSMALMSGGRRCLTMLPIVLSCLISIKFVSEVDVVSLQMKLFQSQIITSSASIAAAFATPSIYLVLDSLCRQFRFLKDGICLVLLLEGSLFLLHAVLVIDVLSQILIILTVILSCICISTLLRETRSATINKMAFRSPYQQYR